MRSSSPGPARRRRPRPRTGVPAAHRAYVRHLGRVERRAIRASGGGRVRGAVPSPRAARRGRAGQAGRERAGHQHRGMTSALRSTRPAHSGPSPRRTAAERVDDRADTATTLAVHNQARVSAVYSCDRRPLAPPNAKDGRRRDRQCWPAVRPGPPGRGQTAGHVTGQFAGQVTGRVPGGPRPGPGLVRRGAAAGADEAGTGETGATAGSGAAPGQGEADGVQTWADQPKDGSLAARKSHWLRWTALAASFLVLIAAGVGWWMYKKLDGNITTDTSAAAELKAYEKERPTPSSWTPRTSCSSAPTAGPGTIASTGGTTAAASAPTPRSCCTSRRTGRARRPCRSPVT
ncbi:hypothetical protein SBADM41S_07030 [Streptomyces badius]